MKLLDLRAFELKSHVHEVFVSVWKALVTVDMENSAFTIREKLDGMPSAFYVIFRSLTRSRWSDESYRCCRWFASI